MGLIIDTNTSLFVRRALNANTVLLQKSAERISTSYRINRAADDPSGLARVEKLTSKIRGYEAAKKNISDGVSLLQTADGGLSVIQTHLQTIRSLMVQGQAGGLTLAQRNALQTQINGEVQAITDITNTTTFNGIRLLDESSGDITIQSGPDGGSGNTTILGFNTSGADLGIDTRVNQTSNGSMGQGAVALDRIRLSGTTVKSLGNGPAGTGTLAEMDTIIDNVSRMRSYTGGMQGVLQSKLDYTDLMIEAQSAARSRIRDADIAEETSKFDKYQLLQSSAANMLKSLSTISSDVIMQLLP